MHNSRRLSGVWFVAAIAALTTALTAQGLPSPAPARVLIVSGGPTKAANQVAIESNVRYLGRIMPEWATYQVLFTDGDLQSETVQYQGENRTLLYRTPNLPRLDGRADMDSVKTALASTVSAAKSSKDRKSVV